jgi:hypothetical protein
MKRLTAAMPLLTAIASATATALLCAPAAAHHSQSMFDTTKEIVVEGTVERFDWVNPHMYILIKTTGPDGKPAVVEGEGVGITQALVDGLDRNALKAGTPVVMRANPNRGGWGKQVRVMDITTQDGNVHPFYAANTRTRVLKPAESLEGHWAPSRAGFGAAMGAMARWPVTPAGRAAQAAGADDGICNPDSPPVLSIFDELRTIEVGDDQVVLQFDNTGDKSTRVIHMAAAHPANLQPSIDGHSIGRWDGQTLVIDTIGFPADSSGLGLNVPAGPRKHLVERLTLTEDRTRLRYEVTVEDPDFLTGPATLTQQWDHRPDLEFAQNTGACDPEVARRYKDSVPAQ